MSADTLPNVEQSETETRKARYQSGLEIIHRHARYNAVAGLVPVPLVDLAIISGVQMKMLAELARLYDIPFADQSLKSYVGSLLGAIVPVSPVSGGLMSVVKAVPLIGPLLTVAVVPGVASASTWAVGRVFLAHFEKGGTFENLNISDVKDRVKSEFQSFRHKDKDKAAPEATVNDTHPAETGMGSAEMGAVAP